MEPLYLLCNGDVTHPGTHGGVPFHLLEAARELGLPMVGLKLDPSRLKGQRRLWNLRQLLTTTQPGGFQYSEGYCRSLLAQVALDPSQSLRLVSIYPHLPAYPWSRFWRVSFYIDATSRQILNDYGVGRRIAPDLQHKMLERERRAYEAAAVLVCRCQWAADSLIGDYGIDPARVHVVPGGANLDEATLAVLPPQELPLPPSVGRPLRLGFLGKEWQRKGGPFLLQLAEALQKRGIPAVVRAIGPDPSSLPAHPRLEPIGFIDKRHEMTRFLMEVRSWHFGTLFSSAEGAPRSNIECLRLGVPVLSHAVGGISATLPDSGCGQLFKPHPSSAEVADWVATRLSPYDAYLAWRAALSERSAEFTWAAAVRQLQPLLEWH